jgi:hypothetical protein
MKKQQIAIATVLLLLACFLGYQLVKQWVRYRAEHRIARLSPDLTVPPVATVRQLGGAQAFNFSAIPDNHPFHIERNNIIPPEPPPQMQARVTAPKPVLMGTMGFSGNSYALMVSSTSREPTVYKKVKVGETVDGYTLVRILPDKVVMTVDGNELDVRLDEVPRPRPQAQGYSGATDSARAVSIDGSGGASANLGRVEVKPAPQDVPEGTIVNGKRKRLVASPFGPTIVWEDVQ